MYVSRKKLHMSDAEIEDFLRVNIWGRLATANLAADPHVTPIGYVYWIGAVFFYSLRQSRRGRDLAENAKAALVIDDGLGPGEDYTKRRGVVLHGRCNALDDDDPILVEVRREFMRATGAGGTDEVQRKTHVWYRLEIERRVSWDFRKIPSGVDRAVDRLAPANIK